MKQVRRADVLAYTEAKSIRVAIRPRFTSSPPPSCVRRSTLETSSSRSSSTTSARRPSSIPTRRVRLPHANMSTTTYSHTRTQRTMHPSAESQPAVIIIGDTKTIDRVKIVFRESIFGPAKEHIYMDEVRKRHCSRSISLTFVIGDRTGATRTGIPCALREGGRLSGCEGTFLPRLPWLPSRHNSCALC